MKTITVFGQLVDEQFRLDHMKLDRANESIDDDTWNTVCSVLSRFKAERRIDETVSSGSKMFSYTFPVTF